LLSDQIQRNRVKWVEWQMAMLSEWMMKRQPERMSMPEREDKN
jgi:hypothetical protein